mgnify:FL=1|tara:strand:+ start:1725 stop:2075 length:351 start_codon:yes stop_codon:yes gene_type:complete
MRKVRLVVETSLHPKSLQMVLQEAVVNPTGFITKVEVEEEDYDSFGEESFRKSLYNRDDIIDLKERHQNKIVDLTETERLEAEIEKLEVEKKQVAFVDPTPNMPGMMPEACSLGGG